MNQVQLCPDAQSPELSVPCSPGPSLGPPSPSVVPTPDIDLIPFTGTAWFWLILGIAVALVLLGLFLLWRSRRKRSEVDQWAAQFVADFDALKSEMAAELGLTVPQLDVLLTHAARGQRAQVNEG